MIVQVFDTPEDVAGALSDRVAAALARRPDLVLGLAAGRTPVDGYAELMARAARGEIDFSRATTFNLDEFVGLSPDHRGSLRRFMHEHLLSGLNVDPVRVHFLDGQAPDLDAECARYDAAIDRAGGIDLQILGIGTNGHIGFNEPGDELVAGTHRVRLADITREDNASIFGGDPSAVPVEALTMGVGTILQARAIVVVATGHRKARGVERALHGPITTRLPASLLQLHRSVDVYLDRDAASAQP